MSAQNASLTTQNVELSYDYWTAGVLDPFLGCSVYKLTPLDDILNAILPEELLDGSPSGFSATGHLGRFSPLDLLDRITYGDTQLT